MFAELTSRHEDDADLDALVYHFATTLLGVSSAAAGGGLGPRNWALNAQVPSNYLREDLGTHVSELASTFHLEGHGVGMFTAATVQRRQSASHNGVDVEATVGLSHPTWAASAEDETSRAVGTINIVAFLPARLSESALINAVATATEAKAQALFNSSISATGTPSDALAIFCPVDGDAQDFCGPRSLWGARLARAVHDSVLAGARAWSS
jgi:adenosylcobinamide amidohydrolase